MTEMAEHECFGPELIECSDLGLYADYEDNLYDLFVNTYEKARIYYQNQPVKLKHYPPDYDSRSCFYHIVCENYFGEREESRKPNLRRCERILYPYHIIKAKNSTSCNNVLCWENSKKREQPHTVILHLFKVFSCSRKENRIFIVSYSISR